MAFDWGGIGDIVGGDSLVGAAEENVGREFAAYNGNIRREVHAQHAQHAFLLLFLLSLLLMSFFFRSFHSSQLCNPKKKKKKKTQVRKLPREDHTCGRGRDPGGSAIYLTRIPASLDRTLNPTLEMSPNLLRILKEEWTDFGLRPERERLKNKKWLARFWKVIVKWIDGKFNRDWEGKVRVLEREREQLTIRVLQRKKWEK